METEREEGTNLMLGQVRRVCVKCQRELLPTEPMFGEGFCRHCAPPLDPNSTQSNAPLTDAEVDAFLKAHENDPIDEESARRVEWLFRKKLAAAVLADGHEWLRSYQEDVVERGRRCLN